MTADQSPDVETAELEIENLTEFAELGVLRWTSEDGVIHLNLGHWRIGRFPSGPAAEDEWHGNYVELSDVHSFTPCALVEREALDRLRNQQGHDGLGVTTSAALGAFFEHVEAMDR